MMGRLEHDQDSFSSFCLADAVRTSIRSVISWGAGPQMGAFGACA